MGRCKIWLYAGKLVMRWPFGYKGSNIH